MSNFSGTFPYKLWDLINSPKNYGLQWSKNGKVVILDKKLFQRKCLNKRHFKTSNFLSITKQLNVYGFVQQAHRFNTRKFLTYKHDNFQRGCPELLRNFCRRINSSSSKTTSREVSSEHHVKFCPVKFDVITQARLNFKFTLYDNVEKVSQLPVDETSSTDSDSSIGVIYSKQSTPSPAPQRQDPRFLMWNGSSCKEARGLNVYNMHFPHHPLPKPISSSPLRQNHMKPHPYPANLLHECSSSCINCAFCGNEPSGEKEFLNFMPELEELEEIFLDEDFKVVYEETVCTALD